MTITLFRLHFYGFRVHIKPVTGQFFCQDFL
jgi:hypothetical protein